MIGLAPVFVSSIRETSPWSPCEGDKTTPRGILAQSTQIIRTPRVLPRVMNYDSVIINHSPLFVNDLLDFGRSHLGFRLRSESWSIVLL